LVSKGANPNNLTKNKEAKEVDLPLHLAMFEGHAEAAIELVKLGAGKIENFKKIGVFFFFPSWFIFSA
jgi:hypothetical protein